MLRRAAPLVALVAFLAAQRAFAGSDYAPNNAEWNGGARLQALGVEAGLELRPETTLDLSRLTTRTAILIVGPRRPPPSALRRFIAEGGRVAIADDFGPSTELLEALGLRRVPASASMGLGGLEALPVAYPRGRHLLTWGVDWLVTNHPAALVSRDRSPLYHFGGHEGLLFVARHGEGELVALADPSVLTNQMLPFGDNEHFASALLRYLVRGTRARPLLYLHGDFDVRGELPARLQPTGGAEALAEKLRSLAEESAYGVNAAAFELVSQRPIGGIFMALAMFAGGGALLLCAALWGSGVHVRLRRGGAEGALDVEGSARERARLGAALRAELEERLAALDGNEAARDRRDARALAELRRIVRELPTGDADPLAARISGRRLSRVLRLAERVLGPVAPTPSTAKKRAKDAA